MNLRSGTHRGEPLRHDTFQLRQKASLTWAFSFWRGRSSTRYTAPKPRRRTMPNTNVPQGQNEEQTGHGGGNHPFHVTVRTLAGHQVRETVKPDDKVADLTRKAVKYFVNKGELVDGEYAL